MVNKTIVQGRLCADPEMRMTQTGTPVASFTLAWSEKHGENEQKLFLPCVAWRKTADHVHEWFSKGQEAVAEGKLTSRKWQDKNGNNRETVELIVDRIHFCGPKRESQNGYSRPAGDSQPDFGGGYEEYDGELPF